MTVRLATLLAPGRSGMAPRLSLAIRDGPLSSVLGQERSAALRWRCRSQIRVGSLFFLVYPCAFVVVPFYVRADDFLRTSWDSISARITPDQDIVFIRGAPCSIRLRCDCSLRQKIDNHHNNKVFVLLLDRITSELRVHFD